jgi:serine/threonine protein kinase
MPTDPVESQRPADLDALPDEFLPILEEYEQALRSGAADPPDPWLRVRLPVPAVLRSSLEELYWLYGKYDKSPPGPVRADTPLPAIPGYEILGILDRGGMGIVYKARHLKLDRLVALKMLRPDDDDPDQLARFRQEPRR